MGLIQRIFGPALVPNGERTDPATISLAEWAQQVGMFSFNGINYTLGGSSEEIGSGFTSLARAAYKANGVVFACMLVRQSVFSEARFQYRRLRAGRPGGLFGDERLRILEEPFGPGSTTGDLLSRMIVHSDLGGNAFVARRGNRLVVLRPDWTGIVIGSNAQSVSELDDAWGVDAEVLGYLFYPGGKGAGREPVPFLAEDVAHFAPIPDPEARFRGMSWLTPIVRETVADKAMTEHKISFLEKGATPNLIVKMDVPDVEKFKSWIEVFKGDHEGFNNAYKTMFLGAGMDATVVGSDLQQIDFKAVQGSGETRVAAAAGTPPIIVGLSEGLQGSSLNAGNYQSAKRRFSDGTIRPLLRNAAGSLSKLVVVPSDAELWYDDRDVQFFQEDQKDAAEIMESKSRTIKALLDAGFEADSVIDAVDSDDFTRLTHSGLFSVQLQPPGTTVPASDVSSGEPPAPTNGAGSPKRSRDLVAAIVDKED